MLPNVMKINTMGALVMGTHDVSKNMSKHTDLRYHMIRDYIKYGFFSLEHVRTNSNRADSMTKALERSKHEVHTSARLRDYSNQT